MISLDLLAAFCLFALVTSATPGPNNMMVLASGVNVGLRRTMPLVLGIAVGVGLMVLGIGFGLGAVFEAFPRLYAALRYLGAAYLLYLAWKIARSGPVGDPTGRAPLGFAGAIAFQWVNPKAWAMTVGAVATYVPRDDGFAANVLLIAVVFGLIAVPCVTLWAAFGSGMRRFLTHPTARRWFNGAMAAALIASLYPILAG